LPVTVESETFYAIGDASRQSRSFVKASEVNVLAQGVCSREGVDVIQREMDRKILSMTGLEELLPSNSSGQSELTKTRSLRCTIERLRAMNVLTESLLASIVESEQKNSAAQELLETALEDNAREMMINAFGGELIFTITKDCLKIDIPRGFSGVGDISLELAPLELVEDLDGANELKLFRAKDATALRVIEGDDCDAGSLPVAELVGSIVRRGVSADNDSPEDFGPQGPINISKKSHIWAESRMATLRAEEASKLMSRSNINPRI
jgi:hypothetical protein